MNVCDNLGDHLVINEFEDGHWDNLATFQIRLGTFMWSSRRKRMPRRLSMTSTTGGLEEGGFATDMIQKKSKFKIALTLIFKPGLSMPSWPRWPTSARLVADSESLLSSLINLYLTFYNFLSHSFQFASFWLINLFHIFINLSCISFNSSHTFVPPWGWIATDTVACRYETGECTRSGFCNFMHLKPISRKLRHDLYGRNDAGRGWAVWFFELQPDWHVLLDSQGWWAPQHEPRPRRWWPWRWRRRWWMGKGWTDGPKGTLCFLESI